MGSQEHRENVESFLDDHPDAAESLEEIATLDSESPSWTFDQAPVDSGTFGELVSRNVATKTADGEYELVDRDAVKAVLSGDSAETTAGTDDSGGTVGSFSLPDDVDTRSLGALAVSVALVAAARLISYPAVVRGEYVVSPGNDPYFYRYWQANLLERSSGLFDTGMLTAVVSENTRPLTHLLNWWVTELLGGTTGAANTAVTWLPVLASVLLGAVLYFLSETLTRDRRISIVTVLLFALAPGHAALTGVGFLDHHIYQYLWLGLLALGLTWLAVDLQRRVRDSEDPRKAARNHATAPAAWYVAGGVAVSVWASAHTWTGSILVFVPVALYIWGRSLLDIEADLPPAVATAPTLAGVGAGGVLAALFHLLFGWHNFLGGFGPLLVFAGGVCVVGLATLWRRRDLPVRTLFAGEVVLVVLAPALFALLQPAAFRSLLDLASSFVAGEDAVGSASLFSTEQAVILTPLFQTGITLYFALVPLGVATWALTRRYEPGWLVPVCFSWLFLLLATIRLRFVGQLSIFLSVFAAVAVVYLLSALDLGRPVEMFDRSAAVSRLQIPANRAQTAYTALILVILLLFNLLFVPALLGTTTYGDDQFGAVVAIDEHAETTDRSYPANYVFSDWSHNRMYNYFVNGQGDTYAYAQATYEDFQADTAPDDWFSEFDADNATSGGWQQTGYVITESANADSETVQSKLHDQLGAGNASVAHYQLIYYSEDVRAFAVVPGASINTTAAPGTELTVSTEVTVDGKSFTYERTGVAGEDGAVSIRVAYPGEYTLGDGTVTVEDRAVLQGTTVRPGGDG